MKRLIKIGEYETGKLNNICDVAGVLVGHVTVEEGPYHTGVTAILPHSGNMFKEKVVAASFAYNGFGKSIGLMQIEELGSIETPIILTATLNVSKVADGLVSYMLKDNPEICTTTGTLNPVVMECNDGAMSNLRDRILGEKEVFEAINNAKGDFLEGNIGAGCGMKCHGFKGGIGSSSRVITINDKKYTLGVLVNSNFGSSNGHDLVIKGRAMGELIKDYNLKQEEDKGSIIVIVATDAPLDYRQLRRVAKRCEIGIGKTGSYAGNGSGDVMVAFSTANTISHFDEPVEKSIVRFSEDHINKFFKATVEATEEAVLNSMLHSTSVVGRDGVKVKSLNEYKELFSDLLEK